MWMLAQVDRVPGLVSTLHARVPLSDSVRAWHERFHQLLEAGLAAPCAVGPRRPER
jgi:hypothetical protein